MLKKLLLEKFSSVLSEVDRTLLQSDDKYFAGKLAKKYLPVVDVGQALHYMYCNGSDTVTIDEVKYTVEGDGIKIEFLGAFECCVCGEPMARMGKYRYACSHNCAREHYS